MYKYICPNCNENFETKDKRSKFCSRACAASFNNKGRILTVEQKKKVSEALKKYYKKNPNKKTSHKQALRQGILSQKGKHKNPQNLLDLSKRTISKIMRRVGEGCSNCEWNECVCDIHHINGRKIKDADNHNNLSYLCPNCHRKVHNNLISKKDLITLTDYVGDRWKEYYYG
jgi:hypothetical protein